MKSVALVVHGTKKAGLIERVKYNRVSISKCVRYATGTTAKPVERRLGFSFKLQSALFIALGLVALKSRNFCHQGTKPPRAMNSSMQE